MGARVAVWLGLAAAAFGLVVGLVPVTVAGVDCGSGFQADDGGSVACADVRSFIRVAALPFLIVGAVSAAGGLVAPQLSPTALRAKQ